MKILVIDDTQKHLDSAVKTLEGHDVTLCPSYDEALTLLEKMAVDAEGKPCYPGQAGSIRLPYWDAVLCDLLMPAGKDAMGAKGDKYIGQETAVGWSLALVAAMRGAKYVAVASDTNHHDHPASAMLDRLDDCSGHIFNVDGAKVLMTNRIEFTEVGGEEEVECWMCKGTKISKMSVYQEPCTTCTTGKITRPVKGKDWGQILNRLLEND